MGGTSGPKQAEEQASPSHHSSTYQDEIELAKFGKRQQMRRSFQYLSTIAITCTLMITWEGYLTTFAQELNNGGPAGAIYGFIFVWLGSILQALVMAEMASMIPLAGGQYNWVAILAPPSCSKFLSYLCGWLAWISWQAALASGVYLAGTMIQGLLTLNHPGYTAEGWHGTLLTYAIILIALFINTALGRLLPQVENLMLAIHLLGFFGILIPLIHLGSQASAHDVFQTFVNGGGWPTDGLSFFVGLSGSMFAFIGIDTGAHIAEEIQGASAAVPRSMIVSVLISGAMGFAMGIALLYSIDDLDSVLMSASQYPYIEIFANAVGSNAGGTAMVSIVTVMMVCAAVSSLATASRMMWAFAREKGVPGHRFFSRIDRRTLLPLYTIGCSVIISLLLALITIGSTAAFNALTSLTIAGSYSTFALSASVLLHHRLTTPRQDIHWGAFRLGRAGVPVNIAALVYTFIGIFFSFWPADLGPTPASMNWSSLVFGAVIIFSGLYWLVWGRHIYTGPIKEVRLDGDDIVA